MTIITITIMLCVAGLAAFVSGEIKDRKSARSGTSKQALR